MTPEPSPLLSVELPVYFWYETPMGWVIAGVIVFAIVAVAAVLLRLVWLRFKK